MATVQQRADEEVITREEWAWVEGLIHDVAREEKGDLLARRFFEWDLAVRQFRKMEQKRMIPGGPTPIDLEFHALCLHGLLTVGHGLHLDAKRSSPEELARFEIKPEEIAAYVEDLEQSFREWHHGFSEQDLDKVRQAVFSGKA